jgi:peptidoglycan hydrolase-like protein with peptidoglycan-binding domain
MSRVLFSSGATGQIVRGIQSRLNLPAQLIDGQYGKITAQAVNKF